MTRVACCLQCRATGQCRVAGRGYDASKHHHVPWHGSGLVRAGSMCVRGLFSNYAFLCSKSWSCFAAVGPRIFVRVRHESVLWSLQTGFVLTSFLLQGCEVAVHADFHFSVGCNVDHNQCLCEVLVGWGRFLQGALKPEQERNSK